MRDWAETTEEPNMRHGHPAAAAGTLGYWGIGAHALVVLTFLALVLLGVLATGASAAEAPTVAINPLPPAGYTTEAVSGTVEPKGEEARVYAEYATSEKAFEEGQRTFEEIGTIPAGETGAIPVSGTVVGLKPSTEYFFRLDAEVSGVGETYSPQPYPSSSTKAVVAPTSTIDAASAVAARSATLSGAINPNAPEQALTNADVEAGFGVHWKFVCTPKCGGTLDGTIPAGNSAVAFSPEATELTPGTTYEVILVATNDGGEATERSVGPITFTTQPVEPAIARPGVASVAGTAATIVAGINPGGAASTFHIDYGPTAAYGERTPESSDIGSDNTEHRISAELVGLSSGSTYHFHVVATSVAGTSVSQDFSFTTTSATPPNFILPDNRAYEQVTPTEKAGISAQVASNAVGASPDGNRLLYLALAALPGSESAQDFGTYLATRGSDWSTQGLLPPPSLGTAGQVLGWSEDLAYSYVRSNSSSRINFYQRDSNTGQLIFVVSTPNHPIVPVKSLPGGSGLVFEWNGEVPLAPGGAPESSNLYLWNRATGTVSVIGIANTGTAPEFGTFAGSYETAFPSDTFRGGKNHDYYTETAVSTDGEDVYFTEAGTGALFLRLHALRAQSLVEGGECKEPEMACTIEVSASQRTTPEPARPAAFLAASIDSSSTVFFGSSEKLTDNSNTGPADEGFDLYRYQADNRVLTDLTPDSVDPNGAEVLGVLGASADGSRVYFVANGVLGDGSSAGAARGDCSPVAVADATGECNLYLSEGNAGPYFIARLSAGGAIDPDSLNWYPKRLGFAASGLKTARVSHDGSAVVFSSTRALTNYASRGVPEFYRWDVSDRRVTCLSCNRSGLAPYSVPSLFISKPPAGPEIGVQFLTHNLSEDGDRFFFESADKLVQNDVNGSQGCKEIRQGVESSYSSCQNVYQWENAGTGSCPPTQSEGCINLISTGESPEASFFVGADAEGKNVFFLTEQGLVNQDKDELFDVYDARVDGGLASQDAPASSPCAGGAGCREVAPPNTTWPAPGSNNFSEPFKCGKNLRKEKRRGKAICVKRSRHQKKRPHSKRKHHTKRSHTTKGKGVSK